MGAPPHLLPPKKKILNKNQKDIDHQYNSHTWISPPTPLFSKLSFCHEHFLEIGDGCIVPLCYLQLLLMDGLQISIGHIKVCSHQLCVELEDHIAREEQICLFCSLGEVETLYHFIYSVPSTMSSSIDPISFSGTICDFYPPPLDIQISNILHYTSGSQFNIIDKGAVPLAAFDLHTPNLSLNTSSRHMGREGVLDGKLIHQIAQTESGSLDNGLICYQTSRGVMDKDKSLAFLAGVL